MSYPRPFRTKGLTANVSANTGIFGGVAAPKAKAGVLQIFVSMTAAFDFGVLVNDGVGATQSIILGTLVANKQSTFEIGIRAGSTYDFYHNGGGTGQTGTIQQLVVNELEDCVSI